MERRIIKPCILVELKSTIRGGIAYQRVDLEKARIEGNGTEVAKWETTRVIDNKEEYDLAVQVRGKAVNEIRKICHPTGLGLICPMDREAELDTAVTESKKIYREFNDKATCSKINIYVTKWEARDNGEDAVRALSNEVMELIEEMQQGIDKVDADGIRVAANKAKMIAGVLEDTQKEMLDDAIKEARAAARMFIKRIEKEGEKAEVVLAEVRRNDLEKARAAFLDYSESVPESTENLPVIQPQRFADLDVATPEGA